jgi:predicted dinucleotide-binding enzyme
MKKIGIIGTGTVGATIGKKLIELGYEVKMGSRSKAHPKAVAWVQANGLNASEGTFTEAAQFGDIIFICTKGEFTLNALEIAGPENFNGKTVIDLTNPLDFSKGMPPTLLICNNNSLGEEVQKLLAGASVVKTLNTVNCEVMVNAVKCGGEATMFMCGNNQAAKQDVAEILRQFGWVDIMDLGDITAARGTEMHLMLWVRNMAVLKSSYFAFKLIKP